MPYMEEEIKLLTDAELLIKDGDKYKSGIAIISGAAQKSELEYACAACEEIIPLVINVLECVREKPELPDCLTFEELKPALTELLMELDYANGGNPDSHVKTKLTDDIFHTVKHTDGSEWAVMGLEKFSGERKNLELCENDKFDQILILGGRDETALDVDEKDVPYSLTMRQ